MKFGHAIWQGTQESFAVLHGLENKFFGVDPMAYFDRGAPDVDEEIDEAFGVSTGRMGLPLLERIGNTAVLKVHGSLTSGYKWWHAMFPGEVTSYEAIADALEIAVKAEGVTRVLMDLSTGGGYVKGLDNAGAKVRWARNYVEVDAHTDSMAFSAGYWLMSSARKLSASRMAEVGSIGTLLITYSMARGAAMEGIDYKVFRAGEFKALGNAYEELTEKAALHLQDNLEKTNAFFLGHVSQARNLLMSNQLAWGEGRTFFAGEALEVGLIDRVTTLDELLGSTAPQTSTSMNRRYGMKISAEKLAQIEAGADPKDVLTADELKFYTEQLEASDDDTNNTEANEGKPGDGEEEEETTASASATSATTASADLIAMTREMGRLEAKFEVAQETIRDLKAKQVDRDTEMAGLMDVAKVALGNLFTAMGKPKEMPATAAGIVAKFTELQGEMSARFKTGQQTTTPVTEPSATAETGNFRHK